MSKKIKNPDNYQAARFCAKCGERTQWTQRSSDGHPVEVCPSCGSVFYRNSVPCAAGLVLRGSEILLIRRTIEPFKGYWDIPGGFLEYGEHPERGVVREVLEETGLEVKPVELLGFYIDIYRGENEYLTLNIYFICEIEGGEARPLSESDRVEWFNLDELPENIAFWDHVQKVFADLKEKRGLKCEL